MNPAPQTIRAKLLLLVGNLTFCFVTAALFGTFTIFRMRVGGPLYNEIQRYGMALEQLIELKSDLQRTQNAIMASLLSENRDQILQFQRETENLSESIETQFGQLVASNFGPEVHTALVSAQVTWQDFQKAMRNDFFKALLSGAHAEARQLVHGPQDRRRERFTEQVDSAADTIRLKVNDMEEATTRNVRRTLAIVAGVMLALIGVSLGWTIVLVRSINQPLTQLLAFCLKMGGGDLQSRVPLDGPYEIKSLAASFNQMAENLEKSQVAMITAHAQMRQTEKMSAVGQLAAGVAHEINNPLGIILGFSQSAIKRIKDSDALALPLKSIEREALRCKNLVQNLLIFSRQGKANIEDFNLNEIVESTLSIVEAQARVKSVEITKELGVLEPLAGDKNQLQQVIVNLCNNAIDAMPKGGKIIVRTRRGAGADGRWINLEVEDTGSGIPGEIRDKIFNPFFTTKEVGKGTGLGLSLVYEIIQRHKGTIEIKSEVGRGTTFIVSLPANDSTLRKNNSNGV